MCPSYMATRDEKHSTRGRAHALFEMLQGEVIGRKGEVAWDDEHVKSTLDLCLSCKACKSECPVQVDIATYKSEFMAHYHKRHGFPLHAYAFGFIDRWAQLASVAPEIANLSMKVPGVAWLAKKVLHVAQERAIPQFAPYSFTGSHPAKARVRTKTVVLWPDTFNNYFSPQVSESAARVLESAGFDVVIPHGHVCCGRPLYDFGFIEEAKKYMLRNLNRIGAEIDAGLPVVVLEPSCATVFRDELKDLFPNDARAKKLSEQTYLLSEFLDKFAPEWSPKKWEKTTLLHGHCHHKAMMKMTAEENVLRRAGAELKTLDAGCCGMAGPFGFEADKFEVSQTLANRVLLPAVKAAGATDAVISDGFSCKEAIHQNCTRDGLHLAEWLDLASRDDRDAAAPEELSRAGLMAARTKSRRRIAIGAAAMVVGAAAFVAGLLIETAR